MAGMEGRLMRIKVVKDKRLESVFQLHLKKISEENGYVIYECSGDLWISPGSLMMSREEFLKFYRRIKVEDGVKRLINGQIHISPIRRRVLTVRLSDGEYALLKRALEKPISEHARNIVINEIREYFAYKRMLRQRFSPY